MSEHRQALSRQDLTKRLGELKEQGVAEAGFYPSGRLKSVKFVDRADPLELPEIPGKEAFRAPADKHAATREAFKVLQGGGDFSE